MRIGDKVFVRISHMYSTGVIVKIENSAYGLEYLVKVGDGEYWIPKADCISVDALDNWSSEPTTR